MTPMSTQVHIRPKPITVFYTTRSSLSALRCSAKDRSYGFLEAQEAMIAKVDFSVGTEAEGFN